MAANNRLKAARVLLGMTQLALSEKVGAKEITVCCDDCAKVAMADAPKYAQAVQ